MFSSLKYRQKLQYTVLGLCLLLILAYFFSFSRTYEAYQLAQHQAQQLQNVQKASVEIPQLMQQLQTLNQTATTEQFSQGLLFEKVSQFCADNQLDITEYAPPSHYQQDKIHIVTNKITVQGNFKAITRLVYAMEQTWRLGKVASVQYDLKQDRQTKKQYLEGVIFLQNLINS